LKPGNALIKVLPHLPPCRKTRGLDQNSYPRSGDLEKVCNRKPKKFNGKGMGLDLQFCLKVEHLDLTFSPHLLARMGVGGAKL